MLGDVEGPATSPSPKPAVLVDDKEEARGWDTDERDDGDEASDDDSEDEEDDDRGRAVKATFSLARKKTKPVKLRSYDQSARESWVGVGSGAFIDAGGTWVETVKKDKAITRREAGSTLRRSHQLHRRAGVDELRIPRDLSSVTSVNCALTQEVELKPKDLRKAVDEQRL